MDIKVLGTGCTKCKSTVALIEQVAKAKGVSVTLQKVEEMRDIVNYGVMSTPRRRDRRQGGPCWRRAQPRQGRTVAWRMSGTSATWGYAKAPAKPAARRCPRPWPP